MIFNKKYYLCIKQKHITMKNYITLALILITISSFGQIVDREKERIFAPSFDQKYAILEVDNKGVSDVLRVEQELMIDKTIKMSGRQYNQFFDPKIDNGSYFLKKVFICKPTSDNVTFENIRRMANETYMLEYYFNKEGKTIIIAQRVNNGITFKK